MATSRSDISEWFDWGKRDNAAYMVVCCDTFDHDDYPVYLDANADVAAEVKRLGAASMQRVMEVYDLSQPKWEQLDEARTWRMP